MGDGRLPRVQEDIEAKSAHRQILYLPETEFCSVGRSAGKQGWSSDLRVSTIRNCADPGAWKEGGTAVFQDEFRLVEWNLVDYNSTAVQMLWTLAPG
jgi:hypothetical protein